MKLFLTGLFESIVFLLIGTIYSLIGLGFLYWYYLSYKLESFWMFAVGFTPFALLTAPFGSYSMIFGTPDWLISLFI
jgi:hypothetical protein